MPIVLPDPAPLIPLDAEPRALLPVPTEFDPPDLIDDIPPYEQVNPDIQAVLTAVGNELGRLEAARQDLIANWFPASADALLHFYERMLGLPVDPTDLTLTERQQQVLVFMRRLKSLGTGLEWEDTITALVGSQWSYQEHDPADPTSPAPYTITLRLPYSGVAPSPSGVAVAAAGGGSLAAGTFYYAVSATTPFGETLPSAPHSIVVTAGEEVTVTWDAQPAPTTGFNVYRGVDPAALFYLGSATATTFTDTGTGALGMPAPTQDTSGSIHAATALKLARSVTPANLAINAGTSSGFIIGVSDVGDVI